MSSNTPETTGALHIISLTSENVKRLRAVTIRPDGRVITIGGENSQGKSSVLDSIAMALGGGDQIPEEPIRRGAKKARTVLDLGDIIVTRTFTKAGSTLAIEGKDGLPRKGPQELLNRLASAVTFDPFGFTQLDTRKQLDVLRGIVKLDFTAIEASRLKAFDERTGVNRDAANLKAQLAALPFHKDAPAAEESSAAILVEIAEAQKWNTAIDDAERLAVTADGDASKAESNLQAAKSALLASQNAMAARLADEKAQKAEVDKALGAIPKEPKIDVAPLEAELAAIMAKIKSAHAHNAAVDSATNTLKESEGDFHRAQRATALAQVEAADRTKAIDVASAAAVEARKAASEARSAADAKPRRNLAALSERLAGVEQINAKVRANAARTAAEKSLRDKEASASALSLKIEDADEKKRAMLESAKFPVDGLSFGENGVLLNSLPFDQAGDAEKISVSVAIAAALNPTIRVMLIRDGSLIGTKKMELIRELAEKHNLQVWIEVVSDASDKKSSVVIEDGHIAGEEVAEEAPEPVATQAEAKASEPAELNLPPQ